MSAFKAVQILNPGFNNLVALANTASGDLSGTYPGPSVATVGGQTAANVAAGAVIANAATSANTASAVVRRDANGKIIVGEIDMSFGNLYDFTTNNNLQSGTSYTLLSTDTGKVIIGSNASAITFTLPNNMPAGFCCQVYQDLAGQITFTVQGGGTAVLVSRQGYTKTAGIGALVTLWVRSRTTTDAKWVIGGDGV